MSNSKAIEFDDLDLIYNLKDNVEIITLKEKGYLETIKDINRLPFNKGEFFFSDKVWDFSAYKKTNVPDGKFKFNFSNCPVCYMEYLKYFVIIKLLEHKVKVQSIYEKFKIIKNILWDFEKIGLYSIQNITPEDLSKYFMSLNFDSRRIKRLTTELKGFFVFYNLNIEEIQLKRLEKALDIVDPKALAAICKENKAPDIPAAYFDRLIKITLEFIRSGSKELQEYRGIAYLLLLLTQTGLRIGELLNLEINSLYSVSIFNGEEANYLEYKTWKREKGNNTISVERTYINALAKKAYLGLVEEYQEKRRELNINTLFLGGSVNQYPLDSSQFYRLLMKYYYYVINKSMNIINMPAHMYKDLFRCDITSFLGESKKCMKGEFIMVYPRTVQYRVHVCTELYKKGVPLQYIERFMSHLSSEMIGYYVRITKENPQENIDFSMNVFRKIVDKEVEILGGKTGLTEKINEFIEANNYNVATDREEICKKLATLIPIREKSGGVCIKSSLLRECSVDAKTNEMYCAYGTCPNIYHFYYMVSGTYLQAKSLINSINMNKSNGFVRQAQKEINMLKTIVESKVLPQLDSLKNIVNQLGAEKVEYKYPDLQYIIENYDKVYQEVLEWKTLII